jgi:hypothetical protein
MNPVEDHLLLLVYHRSSSFPSTSNYGTCSVRIKALIGMNSLQVPIASYQQTLTFASPPGFPTVYRCSRQDGGA